MTFSWRTSLHTAMALALVSFTKAGINACKVGGRRLCAGFEEGHRNHFRSGLGGIQVPVATIRQGDPSAPGGDTPDTGATRLPPMNPTERGSRRS
jgi:hypothetical protein